MNNTDQMQYKKRINAGIQCPECSSVLINTRRMFASDWVLGFECQQCGCNWSKDYYK